jgi:PPOX class probable F420-dependent enzyme
VTSVPDSHKDLLQSEAATFATIDPDGRPQLSEIWFVADGDDVAISLNTTRQKIKNLQARSQCCLFILDPSTPMRYLEIRGDAAISPDTDGAFAAKVSEKYHTDVRGYDQPGEERVVVRVQPSRINAVDMRG